MTRAALEPMPAVCIVVENLPVPFDRRVWQEARTLREAGYRVSVISPQGKGFEESYQELEGIEIYRYRLPMEGAGAVGYLAEYSVALAASLRLAVKIYRKTRFRILHACNPPDLFFLLGIFFKPFGVRFLFDHHDLCPELYLAKSGRKGFFHLLLRLAERCTFATARVAIATNESYREVALTRGKMPPERTFVVRSCPDLSNIVRLPSRPDLKRGRKLLVAYLGVMGPQEGLDLLLEAIEHIVSARKREDTFFVFIGDGTERNRLMQLSAEKHLESSIQFTGRIPDEELALYLSTADVCVAPDPRNEMNDKSTMNKILEYMAYEKPIVQFDLTEGRRSAGEAALYARPNDPADLAEQIVKLLDSETLRRELGQAGRRRIEAELNWGREKESLLAAYRAALKGA